MVKGIKFLLIVVIVILICGSYYFINNEIIEKNDDKINNIECEEGLFCEKIDNVEYKWTRNTSLDLKDVYNYNLDKLENGTLEITDGVLEFINSENNVLKVFDEFEGGVLYIEQSRESCNLVPLYIVLTDEGKIYYNDLQNGILVDKAFIELESEEEFVEFMLKENSTDYECTRTEIHAKTTNNKVIKLLIHEN